MRSCSTSTSSARVGVAGFEKLLRGGGDTTDVGNEHAQGARYHRSGYHRADPDHPRNRSQDDANKAQKTANRSQRGLLPTGALATNVGENGRGHCHKTHLDRQDRERHAEERDHQHPLADGEPDTMTRLRDWVDNAWRCHDVSLMALGSAQLTRPR